MSTLPHAAEAIAHLISTYPALSEGDATAFLCVCAEDGLSLKTLSKRLTVGQSIATRYVSALERCGGHGLGLVLMSDLRDGGVRRTVHLTPVGREMRQALERL